MYNIDNLCTSYKTADNNGLQDFQKLIIRNQISKSWNSSLIPRAFNFSSRPVSWKPLNVCFSTMISPGNSLAKSSVQSFCISGSAWNFFYIKKLKKRPCQDWYVQRLASTSIDDGCKLLEHGQSSVLCYERRPEALWHSHQVLEKRQKQACCLDKRMFANPQEQQLERKWMKVHNEDFTGLWRFVKIL